MSTVRILTRAAACHHGLFRGSTLLRGSTSDAVTAVTATSDHGHVSYSRDKRCNGIVIGSMSLRSQQHANTSLPELRKLPVKKDSTRIE
jgi:hypothetical protein